jgi:hypothetical protein
MPAEKGNADHDIAAPGAEMCADGELTEGHSACRLPGRHAATPRHGPPEVDRAERTSLPSPLQCPP